MKTKFYAPLVILLLACSCHSLPPAQKVLEGSTLQSYRSASFVPGSDKILAIRGRQLIIMNSEGKIELEKGSLTSPYLQATSNGNIIAALAGRKLQLLDLSGKVLQEKGETFETWQHLAFSKGNKSLLWAIIDDALFQVTLSGNQVKVKKEISPASHRYTWAAGSYQKSLLATVADESLRIIDFSGKEILKWGGMLDVYQAALFAPGDTMLVALQQGNAVFIDFEGNVLKKLRSSSEQISSFAFSSDGSRVVMVASGKIKVYDSVSLQLPQPGKELKETTPSTTKETLPTEPQRGRPARGR